MKTNKTIELTERYLAPSLKTISVHVNRSILTVSNVNGIDMEIDEAAKEDWNL